MVPTCEHSGWGDDACLRGSSERFHADIQEAIAGLTLDDLVWMSLFCQSLSQQALEQAEGMCVQFTHL